MGLHQSSDSEINQHTTLQRVHNIVKWFRVSSDISVHKGQGHATTMNITAWIQQYLVKLFTT